jgi:hypothetical protein
MRRRFFSRSVTGLAASFIALGIAASPAEASGTRSIQFEFGADSASASAAVVSIGKIGRTDATARGDSVTVTGSSFRVNSTNG